MKRKWCSVFLAGILAAGSIFPGGNVFAESEDQQEIVMEEEAEEEAQDAGETEGTENTEVTSEPVQETSDTDQVVIYHTNDIHGAFEAAEGGSVGVAKAATLKKETENALLVNP